MTETSSPSPSSQNPNSPYETIVHDLWRGSVRIELTGHLNIWIGHKVEFITPAMVALKSGVPPQKVLWEAFPNWESLSWVEAGFQPAAPADIFLSVDGFYIGLGPAQGKTMKNMELIKAFREWMLDWEAEEHALACAEEHEDAAAVPPEPHRPKSTRYGLGTFVITAGLLFLAYDAFKIFIPADITKRESIGVLLSAHSSSDWSFPWLVETDRGVYPVAKVLMIDKGAPLTLVALSNGRSFVCEEKLVVCARTVGEERRISISAGGQ